MIVLMVMASNPLKISFWLIGVTQYREFSVLNQMFISSGKAKYIFVETDLKLTNLS